VDPYGAVFDAIEIPMRERKSFQYSWLWRFFAQPSNKEELSKFWTKVTKKADGILLSLKDDLAIDYLKVTHPSRFARALTNLKEELAARGLKDYSMPWLFIFDEARMLCDIDALDGTPIMDEQDPFRKPPLETVVPLPHAYPNPHPSFSNFKALRRALRYLSPEGGPIVNVFAVFTDTTSRITNFQPTPWDDWSARVSGLPQPGKNQFHPLYIFPSMDVYSRLLNNTVAKHQDIADPERLLRFGRAGWYSLYHSYLEKGGDPVEASEMVVRLVKSKLLGTEPHSEPFQAPLPLSNKTLIRLLAVLAPRLALTIGPYSQEAAESIASHLGVLSKTDADRHFIRTVYPSEPVIMEASADLCKTYGWARPLHALQHYVKGGVVDAGFRGELLTKIMCLMAMDTALRNAPSPGRWQFSRPIKVATFLDHLIISPSEGTQFSDYLRELLPDNGPKATPKPTRKRGSEYPDAIKVDPAELDLFLNGEVNFNHFIRLETKISYQILVHAYNRNAAIMTKSCALGVDSIIPVLLPGDDESIGSGPLHRPWNSSEHDHNASKRITGIYINSKNYSHPSDHALAVAATKLYIGKGGNFRPSVGSSADPDDDLPMNDKSKTKKPLQSDHLFLSVIQSFGPNNVGHHRWIKIDSEGPRNQLHSQITVVMRGVGPEAYAFLNDENSEDVLICRKYLKELRAAKVDTVDTGSAWREQGSKENIPLMYGEEYLGSEAWTALRIHQVDPEAGPDVLPQINKRGRARGHPSRSGGEPSGQGSK
jgi:hypothetical protein